MSDVQEKPTATEPAVERRPRCRDRRRRLRRPLHAAPPARARAHGAGLRGRQRRRRHLVLEPLPGRALRRREHGVLVPVLRRSSSRSGSGPSATRRSPRSCATSNHVADRFDLRRDIQLEHARRRRRVFDEARGRWTIDTDDGDRGVGALLHHGDGLPVVDQHADVPGPRLLRGRDASTPAAGRTSASTSPASASASSAPARRRSRRSRSSPSRRRTSSCSSARRTTRCRRTTARSTPSVQRAGQGATTPSSAQRGGQMPFGFDTRSSEKSALRGHARRSAAPSTRTRWAQGRPAVPRRVRRPALQTARPTTPPPSSSAARSARSCAIPRVAELLSPRDGRRLQAPLQRHRLLRDLQPPERHAGRPPPRRRSRRSCRTGCGPRRASTSSTASSSRPASTP